jgi:hypothetical protein
MKPIFLLGVLWLSLSAMVATGVLFPRPALKDRPADYWACQQLHPERYCRLEHLPETVAQEENGRR